MCRINPIPRIDICFFKVYSNILPSNIGLPKGLFPVGLPVKILKALLPTSILAICPAHVNLLDYISLTILGERYKLWSSSLWSLLHYRFSSLLSPKIHLRILFSNTLSLHSSLNVNRYNNSKHFEHCVNWENTVTYSLLFAENTHWTAIVWSQLFSASCAKSRRKQVKFLHM